MCSWSWALLEIWAGGANLLTGMLGFLKNIFMDGHRVMGLHWHADLLTLGLMVLKFDIFYLLFLNFWNSLFFLKIQGKGSLVYLGQPCETQLLRRAALLDKTKSKGNTSKCKSFLTTAIFPFKMLGLGFEFITSFHIIYNQNYCSTCILTGRTLTYWIWIEKYH